MIIIIMFLWKQYIIKEIWLHRKSKVLSQLNNGI